MAWEHLTDEEKNTLECYGGNHIKYIFEALNTERGKRIERDAMIEKLNENFKSLKNTGWLERGWVYDLIKDSLRIIAKMKEGK